MNILIQLLFPTITQAIKVCRVPRHPLARLTRLTRNLETESSLNESTCSFLRILSHNVPEGLELECERVVRKERVQCEQVERDQREQRIQNRLEKITSFWYSNPCLCIIKIYMLKKCLF